MAINANALNPSLVNELNDMKRRLAALERQPDIDTKFDRYPTVEWAATGRGKVANNVWSSCGIANVTGLVYDRIECRFITHNIITGKREPELRLAAFRHSGEGNTKECVSATNTLRLKGSATAAVHSFTMQWIHGIPYGWDYEDGDAVYTIELQHRYAVGPDTSARVSFVAPMKLGATDNDGVTGYSTTIDNQKWWQLFWRDGSGWGWSRRTIGDDGSYDVSGFHYCVGLPPERAPYATDGGWLWTNMSYDSVIDAGPGNINDPWIG